MKGLTTTNGVLEWARKDAIQNKENPNFGSEQLFIQVEDNETAAYLARAVRLLVLIEKCVNVEGGVHPNDALLLESLLAEAEGETKMSKQKLSTELRRHAAHHAETGDEELLFSKWADEAAALEGELEEHACVAEELLEVAKEVEALEARVNYAELRAEQLSIKLDKVRAILYQDKYFDEIVNNLEELLK